MIEQKEKLTKLIESAYEKQENEKCRKCDLYDCEKCVSEYIAGYLLNNGVAVLPYSRKEM